MTSPSDNRSTSDNEQLDVASHYKQGPHNAKKVLCKKLKKPARSLTDEEYDEIFNSVIRHAVERNGGEEAVIDNDDQHNGEQERIHQENPSLHFCSVIQQRNEVTPEASDEETDNDSSSAPPPIKKKNMITNKRSALGPKQLTFIPPDVTNDTASFYKGEKKQNSKKNPQGKNLSSKENLIALQNKRVQDADGTWVQCTNSMCSKWRYLPEVKEPYLVPHDWVCSMNTDTKHNSCSIPEVDYSNLDFVFTKFTAGSVVWAKIDGYPWWPAMVEDDPDVESFFWTNGFSDVPTAYHVVFLDEIVTRAWVGKHFIRPFATDQGIQEIHRKYCKKKYENQIREAKTRATEALKMTIEERLKSFSFAYRYKGAWSKSKTEDMHYLDKKDRKSKVKEYREELDYSKIDTSDLLATPMNDTEAASLFEELDEVVSIDSLDMFDTIESDPESKEIYIQPKNKNEFDTVQVEEIDLREKTFHKEFGAGDAVVLLNTIAKDSKNLKKSKERSVTPCERDSNINIKNDTEKKFSKEKKKKLENKENIQESKMSNISKHLNLMKKCQKTSIVEDDSKTVGKKKRAFKPPTRPAQNTGDVVQRQKSDKKKGGNSIPEKDYKCNNTLKGNIKSKKELFGSLTVSRTSTFDVAVGSDTSKLKNTDSQDSNPFELGEE
ncbi:uncharacterized protein LOC143231121 [Tachypleus tridentatus]|uniref:uncharacterized protein LOC143231121 n=1 Tax=Tachypleus tridentatus TaxID=6853 RepID=UPI003FD0AABB